MKNFKLIASVFIGLGLALAGLSYFQDQTQSPKISATEIPSPSALTEFHLKTAEGQDFTKASLLGKYTVLYFGFTRCPDACPTTLAQFRSEIPKLSPEAKENVQFLLLTVDPEHDTGPLLKQYVEGFHKDIHALTGTEAEIHNVAAQMKTTFHKIEETAGEVDLYQMAHSPRYFIIDPKAQLTAVYNPPIAPGVLALDLNQLVAANGKSRWLF